MIGTSSRMNGPSLPALNRVSSFFDTFKRASAALWGIFIAFCNASNCTSIRLSKSFSSSTLPSNSDRVVYREHWTSVTRSWTNESENKYTQVSFLVYKPTNIERKESAMKVRLYKKQAIMDKITWSPHMSNNGLEKWRSWESQMVEGIRYISMCVCIYIFW